MVAIISTWRKKWQPTPVFLPGESHGRRSLVGYSPWGCTESDTTEATWEKKKKLFPLTASCVKSNQELVFSLQTHRKTAPFHLKRRIRLKPQLCNQRWMLISPSFCHTEVMLRFPQEYKISLFFFYKGKDSFQVLCCCSHYLSCFLLVCFAFHSECILHHS